MDNNKQTIKKFADVERVVELARNTYNNNNVYDINSTDVNVGGTPLDKQARKEQLARSEYTQQNPYNINSID